MPDRSEPNFAALQLAVRTARIDAGLTWDALAERTGMERRGLQWLVSGQRRGTLEGWWRLARALELDFGDLVRCLDAPEPEAEDGERR